MQRTPKKASPGFATLRAKLIERGYTIRSAAKLLGHPYPTVYCAARGTRAGVKSVQILNQLEGIAYA